MIFYNDKNYKKQIETDYKELEKYKNSYNKKISLYNLYLDTMLAFKNGAVEKSELNEEELKNKIKNFQNQINKIDVLIEFLNYLLKIIGTNEEINITENILNKYNQEYSEISNNYITNSVGEEQITINYINGLMTDVVNRIEKSKEENIINSIPLKNNDTLLISEILNKVILPYRAEEVLEIFNSEDNKYESFEDVIEDKFTRNFSNYKIQFISRYNETMKLARERENYNMADAILLATEMMKKRYLHPAIIAACKNLNELDVYLDCLDKNELEDFKIFKIKYELYPMVVKQSKWARGKRYKDDSNAKAWEF